MVRGLGNLIVKEVKEMLRDPKIIFGMVLIPLIMFPVMGVALSVSQTAIEESLKNVSVAFMDLDRGSFTRNLTLYFDAVNVTLIEVEASTLEEALQDLQEGNLTTLIVTPPGFSVNLTLGRRGELDVYSVVRGLSLSEGAKVSLVNAPVGAYENLLVEQAIKKAIPARSPDVVLDPISIRSRVIFKGELIEVPPEALTAIFLSQSFGFPIVIMMLLVSAMQVAATSIAIEKEEKTLETLLTLPISRLSILTGKLVGSVIIAAVGAIASLVGVNYYTGSIFTSVESFGSEIASLGLVLSPTAYVMLGITMFVTIISALALAICVAVFADNVRSAQSLVSYLMMLIVVPSLILMFADVEILPFPLKAVLYAIPYTHTIIASNAAFLGDYLIMLRSIAYISLFTIVILYIAAKIFTTEKIVTSRISLRGFRRKR